MELTFVAMSAFFGIMSALMVLFNAGAHGVAPEDRKALLVAAAIMGGVTAVVFYFILSGLWVLYQAAIQGARMLL